MARTSQSLSTLVRLDWRRFDTGGAVILALANMAAAWLRASAAWRIAIVLAFLGSTPMAEISA